MTEINIPQINQFDISDLTAKNFYLRLQEYIKQAQDELKENEQISVCYYDQGGNPISIEKIGFNNPDMFRLYGKDEQENECFIFTHFLTVQLVLKIIKFPPESRPPKKHIGFIEG